MTSNIIVSTEKDGAAEDKNARKLKPLHPRYNPEQHRTYVDALNDAIQQDEVTNIALSGPYGVGKSSILQGFREDHPGAIFISLSTLGFSKSVGSSTSELSDGSISPQTNQIQKEIVKQLLYRKPPNELPVSRFKRIQKPDWKHLLVVSTLIAFALTIVIAAIGGFSKIPKVCDSAWQEFGVKFFCLWLLLSLATWLASKYLRGAVHLDKFTAGPATLTLSGSDSGNDDSYFDRYLDEIIYFFEMSTCRIVVFEDIDRFSNWEIFEELHELNTLLNNAEQLQERKSKSDENKVVFIYAMKDSIFEPQTVTDTDEVAKDTQDRAIQEIQRANRTKFFDVIIPVVPFVTHRSARDLMRQELEGVKPKISDELIDHVAKYIPDFRLLRSVCNEYTIYAQFILGDGGLKLEPDKLFALMLYKSVHLKDFERIHLDQSKLGEVYRMSVRVTAELICAINEEYDELEKQQDPHAEAKMRGEALEGMISWASEHFELRGGPFSVGIGPLTFSEDEIDTVRFWNHLCQLSDVDAVTIEGLKDRYDQPMPLKYSKSDMAKFIGRDLVSTSIVQRTKDDIGAELRQLDADRQRYQSAHMSDLMSEPSVMVPSENGAEQTFSAYVEKTLGSKLAAALIRHGYIDQNFVLYTSTYHTTSLSANAMTFRMQHIGRGLMNLNYPLNEKEVKQLILDRTIDISEFARPGSYNVHILNFLLSNKKKYRQHFETIIASIVESNESGEKLLKAFLASGQPIENRRLLVVELAPKYFRIINVLMEVRGIAVAEVVEYSDVALRFMVPETKYDTAGLKSAIEEFYQIMPVFTGPVVSDTADKIVALIAEADVKFVDISVIHEGLRKLVIEGGYYKVNRQNLDAVSDDHQPALDILFGEKPVVYTYLLQSLKAYFAIIAEDKSGELSALVGSADTAKVIADVVKLDVAASTRPEDLAADNVKSSGSEALPLLSSLLASSGGNWSIDLDGLPSSCWSMLAAHDRLAVTTSNLWLYINKCGVDDALIELLERHSSIENQDDALSNDEYIELAIAILNLKEEQISAKQRAALVASMDHSEPIPVSRIEPQDDGLVGILIKAGLIDDNSDAYRLLSSLDWPNREFVIASSRRFADYMDSDLIGNDVLSIFQSQSVPVKVKQNIINNISSYCYGMNVEDLTSLAKYAASQQDLTASGDALIWLLNQGVKPNVVVPLLVTGLDSLSDPDVRNIMMALGRPYSDLLEKGVSRVHVDEIMGIDRLLERLKDVGEVTTYTKDGRKRRYAVYRHRGPKP